MSLSSNIFDLHHLQSHKTANPLLPITTREFRAWKRPRLKINRRSSFVVHNQLDKFFSQFSFNSLDLLAPALGLASGAALYLSRSTPNPNSQLLRDVGEWILFTTPSPFNRFVMLRCPSITFQGSELLEDVNEKLVQEERHFVRLNSGRIQVRRASADGNTAILEEKLVYQRICVGSEDGGVISLDWPANLDLKEEHGLDTTVLLVPGTAEGSGDKNIRSFVCECLNRGCFPVVMNPRGSAGSPLTTARLFTAADSDDVYTAIQFINGARPWTTLVGVGWGYGANMLAKYLAEVGEKTPLVAATCIDNPFDLEEATSWISYFMTSCSSLDNSYCCALFICFFKEIFQGRAKGFDVEKALLATSLRDFEKEISMVSFGFNAIEDFYRKCSTRGLVGNVKIPLLFIQNDGGMVPQFSIPRSSIAENPFTSLLLCSSLPSNVITYDKSAISWSQRLTIEWLTAVELGLLKGRHPLLKDVDVTINPSKGLALMEGRTSKKSGRVNKLLNFPHLDDLNGRSIYPLRGMIKERDTSASFNSRSGGDTRINVEVKDKGSQQDNSGALDGTSSVEAEAEIVKEEVGPVDGERGQVLQTAEVVMNMLDVTMPDTLTEERKKKVLAAMGQGETLMTALQDAVPEDVRGKLTTAVSGILHNPGSNLKLDGLLNVSQMPDVASGLKSRLQESVGGLSRAAGSNEDPSSIERADDMADSSNKNQPGMDKSFGALESEPQSSENLQIPTETGQSQLTSKQGSDVSGSAMKGIDELRNSNENAQYSENEENGPETGVGPKFPSRSDTVGGTEDVIIDHHEIENDGGIAQSDIKEDSDMQQNEERHSDPSTDQNNAMSSSKTDETLSPSASSLETQSLENEGSETQRTEEKSTQPVPNQTSSNSPSFSVSQAFEALTGIDDSTQVAVNSVFNVIEDMITQLEVERDDGLEVEDSIKEDDQKTVPLSENHQIMNDDKTERKEGDNNDMTVMSDKLDDINSQRASFQEEKPIQNAIVLGGNNIDNSQGGNLSSHIGRASGKGDHLVSGRISSENSDKLVLEKNPHRIPLGISTNPYGDSLYKEYLRNYLISKMKNTQSLDLDTTTALFLDYFPEEGQWKLLDQAGPSTEFISDVAAHKDVDRKVQDLASESGYEDEIIEPSYVILDGEKQGGPVGAYEMNKTNEKVVIGDYTSNESVIFVKNVLLDSLRVEVGRRLSTTGMDEMESNLSRDLDHVANAVSLAVGHEKEFLMFMKGEESALEKVGTVHGERIIRAISSAVEETSYLRKVLPVGVIVGSSLVSLRKLFNVVPACGNGQSEQLVDEINGSGEINSVQEGEIKTHQILPEDIDQQLGFDNPINRYEEEAETKSINNNVMVGAVTAALGASALLAHQQGAYIDHGIPATTSMSFGKKDNYSETGKLEEEMSEKNENIVSSLAEKAMSVAGPAVPMKEGGGLDQERLVAMLAEWGQRGGMLRLVGKFALLWGGLRGATSLTEKLMSFLRIGERPLLQRILGFVGMVLILWTPVVVPLLPTLTQGWATHNSSKIAEFACIIGLYMQALGKCFTIREAYSRRFVRMRRGVRLKAKRGIQNFMKGLIGGVVLVLLTQSVNAFLGCVHLSLPSTPSSLDGLKVYGQMLVLLGQGLVTATGVAIVEELFFRSWLPEEISVELGYHRGIIISGLAFSLFQRSPWAAPGLWLLSVGLAGARERCQGSLLLPVGLRAGMIASSFILQTGGYLSYHSNLPIWVTGTHPFEPFSGIVGMTFALLLAIVLYPRQAPPLQTNKITKTIRE
ncbi:hypothetical protein LguiA_003080 [Lonicera macranthoides]